MKNWFHIEGVTQQGIKSLEDRIHGLSYVKDYLSNHVQTPIKLLDLGCAEGLIGDWLLSENDVDSIVGIDANQESIDLSKQVFADKTNYHFNCCDLNHYTKISQFEQSYDIVLLLAILQKLKNPIKFLEYVISKTSPQIVAIRVPQFWIDLNLSKMNNVMEKFEYKQHNQVKGDHENQGVLFVYIKNTLDFEVKRGLNTSYKKEISKLKELNQADNVLISFPKSGRTWLRYIFAKYVQQISPLSTFDLEFIPNHHWNDQRHEVNFPRVFLTHNYLDYYQNFKVKDQVIHSQYIDQKPVVFLHRHPLDVIVSYYNQITQREKRSNESLSDFVNNELYGIQRHCEFMNNILDYLQKHNNVHYLSYEKLKEDTFKEISQMFAFWNYDFDPSLLHAAVEESKFDKMQEVEKGIGVQTARLSLSAWDGNHQSLKVRKGKSFAYREEMSAELADQLENNQEVIKLLERLKNL